MDRAPGNPPPPAAGAPAELLGKRAARGAAGLTLFRVGARLLGAVELLIFSRMRGDESMGVIGIGLLTIATVEVFSQLGIRKALIQRPGDIADYYGTAFTFQALRGFAIALAMFLGAPFIAAWFREPAATPVLQAFALIPALRGVMNIAVVQLERDLQFAKVIAIDVGTPILEFVIVVTWLLIDPGIMALVWGKVIGVGAAVALSYALVRQPWRIGWSTPRFLELIRFGAWLLLTGVISLLVTRGADFVVGRTLTTAEMGVYTLGIMLAVLPMTELNTVVSRVAFPAYARLQNDPERLRSAFLRSFLVVAVVVTGAMTIVVVAAEPFVALALGPGWAALGEIMPLLAVWGACRALGGATTSVFLAVGKPAWVSYFHTIMLVMLAATLIPLARGAGLPGVAWTLALVGLGAQTIRYGMIARLIGAPARALYARTFIPFALAGAGVLAAWALTRTVPAMTPAAEIVVLPAVAGLVYAAGLLLWDRTGAIRVIPTLLAVVPERVRPGSLA